MTVEASGKPKRYTPELIPLKGSYYEAVNGITFKIIGNYNRNTFIWRLDCFDQQNKHTSFFLGKEDHKGHIQGKWSTKKQTRSFYLMKKD